MKYEGQIAFARDGQEESIMIDSVEMRRFDALNPPAWVDPMKTMLAEREHQAQDAAYVAQPGDPKPTLG